METTGMHMKIMWKHIEGTVSYDQEYDLDLYNDAATFLLLVPNRVIAADYCLVREFDHAASTVDLLETDGVKQ